MQLINSLDDFDVTQKTAICIGKFDGFHRGHMSLVEDIKEYKRMNPHCVTVVFAFFGISNMHILTLDEKHELAAKMGIDYLLEISFNFEIKSISAYDFLTEILLKRLNMEYLAVGTDFRFGRQRKGDIELLKTESERLGFGLGIHSKLQYDNEIISSTYIKEKIKQGEVDYANTMLGYNYFVMGRVVHGNRLGSTELGFPTVNIMPKGTKLLPKNGVYISRVFLDGSYYSSISNLGSKPTVSSGTAIVLESFILDGSFDCYEKIIRVELLQFVRDEKHFASLDELRNEISKNVEQAREYFEAHNELINQF